MLILTFLVKCRSIFIRDCFVAEILTYFEYQQTFPFELRLHGPMLNGYTFFASNVFLKHQLATQCVSDLITSSNTLAAKVSYTTLYQSAKRANSNTAGLLPMSITCVLHYLQVHTSHHSPITKESSPSLTCLIWFSSHPFLFILYPLCLLSTWSCLLKQLKGLRCPSQWRRSVVAVATQRSFP